MGNGYARRREHEFTSFEIQIALSLMVKGKHLMTPDKYKRGELIETSERSKREVYTDFATLLNETLHGTDYALDIDKRDVAALINRLLVEHKSLLGPGGYIERGRYKRLNRAINRSFLSNRKQNFNGSLQEWKMGRKHEMEDKERREKGLPTREEEKARAQAREEEIRTRKARELADIEEQLNVYRAEKAKQKENAPLVSTSILEGLLPSTEHTDTSGTVSPAETEIDNAESISASVVHSLLPSIETPGTEQLPPTEKPRHDVLRDEYGRPLPKPRVRANNSRFIDTSRSAE